MTFGHMAFLWASGQRVEEAQRGLALAEPQVIQQRDDPRRRGRGAAGARPVSQGSLRLA